MALVLLLTTECQSRYAGVSSFESEVIKEFDNILTIEPTIKRLLDLKPTIEEIRSSNQVNERPVIGIFTQPYNDTSDYIMAAYVKFVEASGARAIPIVWRDSDEDILKLVPKMNGVLFPGGGTSLKNKDGSLTEYSRKGELVLNKVKELNDQGIYYPILAICLGFQEVSQIEAPYVDTLETYYFDADDISNNVTLKSTISESKLFNEMPQHLITAIEQENITYNHHHDGVLPSAWNNHAELRDAYHLLGVSYDEKDIEYVAFVESKNYPIWGLQFHPEKNIFIWKPDLHVPHSPTAIELSQFLSNFFIREARKNFNQFDSDQDAFDHMIEHIAVDLTTAAAQDIYVFDINNHS
ncbi:unnamed protein product [Moneuplotes crassus]|uniref:folate gamma-glutamyl hydrolase n=1 Tax=Euplotes crassus TaxID=5936 RepID=A0AAD1UTC1_EUPCR|nr:unnamed protein product [Moneuplotes crassus]